MWMSVVGVEIVHSMDLHMTYPITTHISHDLGPKPTNLHTSILHDDEQ